MGTELVSGPFRYIVQVAQFFKKTEQDMRNLENILMSLHKELSVNHSRKNEESTSDEISLLDARIKAEKAKYRLSKGQTKVNSSNKVQTKTRVQTKISVSRITARNFSHINLENHPHWFIRVAEFYNSVSNAFSDLRKYLKNACKEYAREMIICVRYYKQNAENATDNLEKDIEEAIESLRKIYEKKIDGLTSMIRLCEQQRSAISENKMKLLSEIEINTVEIICIKETTLKLFPSITTQEGALETITKKEKETAKLLQEKQEHLKLLKKARFKLVKHNNRAISSRNSFLRELNKITVKLSKSIEISLREAEKLTLKELSERGNNAFAAMNKKNHKNKIISLRKQILDTFSYIKKSLDETCIIEKEIPYLEEEEKKVLFVLQSTCLTSHKLHNDLKKTLANKIKKLQNILYVGRMKQNASIIPIEHQITSAKETYNSMSENIEHLEDKYTDLCDRLEEAVNARENMKRILESTEGQWQELDINLLMLENGYMKFVQKRRSEFQDITDEELEVLIEENINLGRVANACDLEIFKYHLNQKQRILLDLRQKEYLLERSVQTLERSQYCLKSGAVAVAHVYMSILMFPASYFPQGETCDLPLLNDANLGPSRMPDILMTGSCYSIDRSIKRSTDEQSSKCSHKSRKKAKTWTKFENSLRRNLVNELRRVMKVE